MNISLKKLASMENPFEDPAICKTLEKRLTNASVENRFLEWKSTGLFGDSATNQTKYRTVKVIISFANTEGGFVVFGISNEAIWKGLKDEEIKEFDMSKIEELVNSSVIPSIKIFNLYKMKYRRKNFIVLHVPPSDFVPHITVKEIQDQSSGRARIVLRKHYLYCRYGSKSDIAKPSDYQKITSKRAELLRNEMLRRFKEVTVNNVNKFTISEIGGKANVKIISSSKDETLPIIRISRDSNKSQGTFLHETLSESIFEEINNVVESNELIAKSKDRFVFGENIYYRIYAERQHVINNEKTFELFARTGMFQYYAPVLFWIIHLKPSLIAKILCEFADNPKYPNVYNLMRIVILLGIEAVDWLYEKWEKRWGKLSQPPQEYFTLKDWKKKIGKRELLLVALKKNEDSTISFVSSAKEEVVIKDIIGTSKAENELSALCLDVFNGVSKYRDTCRHLDLIVYGPKLSIISKSIKRYLLK